MSARCTSSSASSKRRLASSTVYCAACVAACHLSWVARVARSSSSRSCLRLMIEEIKPKTPAARPNIAHLNPLPEEDELLDEDEDDVLGEAVGFVDAEPVAVAAGAAEAALPKAWDATAVATVAVPSALRGSTANAGAAHGSIATVAVAARLRRRIRVTVPSWLMVNRLKYTVTLGFVDSALYFVSRCPAPWLVYATRAESTGHGRHSLGQLEVALVGGDPAPAAR